MQNFDRARARRSARVSTTTAASTLALAMAAGLMAGAARAADDTTPSAETPDYGTRVSQLTVNAQPGGAIAVAPVKAPIQSIEPTSIVTHDAIDQFVPQTADFSEVVLLTPSVSGISFNGPGLYEAKTTLRGFQDAQYNITYDGIPFGDTNDPSHHSTSFFPASNIGAASVERGPGSAGQLGQANFGGSINLFSPEVSDTFGGSEQLTYGSWNTAQSITKFNTGDIPGLNGAHALIALSELTTDGYLTHSGAYGLNQMARVVLPLTGTWKLTLFGSVNETHVFQDDNNGATRTQVALFGKNFALTSDPTQPTFFKFNQVNKHTDFEYARLAGAFTEKLSLEDIAYTYYYDNSTLSAQDVTTPASAQLTHPFPSPSKATLLDVPGYTKLNHYRVYGEILRLDADLGFATLKSGVWLEHSDTHRRRMDFDLTAGMTPDFREKAGTAGNGIAAPQNIFYDQHSNWDQVQPFIDFEWHVTSQLTVTPGFKYLDFTRHVSGPFNQGTRNGLTASDHFTKPLYFLTANYRIMENWSVYAQYATGFLEPALAVLQKTGPNTSALKPQETVNYQVGTVFHSAKLTFDADYYYIDFRNLLQSTTGGTCPSGETCFFNLGGAVYQGVEGQATYALSDQLFVFANGSWNAAKNKATGRQIANGPLYTAAAGAIWKSGDWSASLFDKLVGDTYQIDAADNTPASLAAYRFYKLGAYNNLDLTVAYTIGRWRFQGSIYNLLDSQQATKIAANSGSPTAATTPFDQLYFQPARNFQLSVRLNF